RTVSGTRPNLFAHRTAAESKCVSVKGRKKWSGVSSEGTKMTPGPPDPFFVSRMRGFIAALSLIAAVGCRAAKEPVPLVASELISLDDAKLVKEFGANRKGALDHYVNKIIEIEIDGIEASKTKDSKLKCDLRPTQSSKVLFYEATFDLKDKLNAALEDKDSHEFPLVVRGQIRAIEQIDPGSNLFEVRLDPAWIRPIPPRGVLSI